MVVCPTPEKCQERDGYEPKHKGEYGPTIVAGKTAYAHSKPATRAA